MRYTDNGGDIWEDVGDDMLRVVELSGKAVEEGHAGPSPMEYVETNWGPLTPLVEPVDAPEPPSDGLPSVSDVMDRASVFQSAHALVSGLKWDEREWASIYDVLQVAKWMETGE